jgi:probable HAF family extracellular repeat protein
LACRRLVTYDGSFHAVPLPPGTASSSAIGLNLEGVILGAARGGAAGDVVFLWTQRRGVQLVPFLPGDHADAAAQINLFSAVVGFSVVSRTPGACFHPWVWAPGLSTPKLLPLLTGFHPEASCSAFARTQNINDLGVVVGFGSTAQGQTHAIRWIPKSDDPDARAFMARPE